MDLTNVPMILKDFLFYNLTIRARSARTVGAYYQDLKMFLSYIYCIKNGIDTNEMSKVDLNSLDYEFVKKITMTDVYEFLNFITSTRSNNPNTRARKTSTIRSYFKFLTNKSNILEKNPVESLESPSIKKSLPKFLNLEETIELIATSAQGDSRDYCIITLFLNCGMRVSELRGINLYDIKGDKIRILGKGNKERMLYLNNSCLDAIERYKVERSQQKIVDNEALFLSKNGTRLTVRRIQQIVENTLKQANLDGRGFSPHKLRHTAATLMYQHSDIDINVIKDVLGHESIATTQIYTHVSSKQVEDAMKSSPLSNIKYKKTPKD